MNFLNLQEISGEQSNPLIKQFYQQSGHPDISSDEVPWCAAFVGAVLKQSGLDGTNSLMARSYQNWGKAIEQPEMGAIAVFKRGEDPTLGHVGFVIASTKEHVLLLGGNQRDRVSIEAYPKTKLLNLRWPDQKKIEHVNIKHQKTFEMALKHVLQLEGGWSNHPADKGGPTNKGITIATFKRAINQGLITPLTSDLIAELKRIKHADVEKIYFHFYWQIAGCSQLPDALAILHFDAAVNHGPTRSIKFLQAAIGAEIDGEFGPETSSKITTTTLNTQLQNYLSIRKTFYQNLKQFPIFGKGWIKRLQTIETLATAQLPSNNPDDITNNKEPTSMPTDNNMTNSKWLGESLTIWGTIVTALSTILPIIGPFIGLDITGEMIEQLGETVARLIQLVGGITGTTMTLYGRTRASTTLNRRAISMKL